MSILLININPQKEKFHNYDFSVYTASKCRDMKLDTDEPPGSDPTQVNEAFYGKIHMSKDTCKHDKFWIIAPNVNTQCIQCGQKTWD